VSEECCCVAVGTVAATELGALLEGVRAVPRLTSGLTLTGAALGLGPGPLSLWGRGFLCLARLTQDRLWGGDIDDDFGFDIGHYELFVVVSVGAVSTANK